MRRRDAEMAVDRTRRRLEDGVFSRHACLRQEHVRDLAAVGRCPDTAAWQECLFVAAKYDMGPDDDNRSGRGRRWYWDFGGLGDLDDEPVAAFVRNGLDGDEMFKSLAILYEYYRRAYEALPEGVKLRLLSGEYALGGDDDDD